MEQSPSWQANQFSASLEITHILGNLKVNYGIYKCRPPSPTLSQNNSLFAPPNPTSWRSI
jgi:hypothetical protein